MCHRLSVWRQRVVSIGARPPRPRVAHRMRRRCRRPAAGCARPIRTGTPSRGGHGLGGHGAHIRSAQKIAGRRERRHCCAAHTWS
eukprot:scaffold12360_cov109-Isochrysis_galbana.AAC.14